MNSIYNSKARFGDQLLTELRNRPIGKNIEKKSESKDTGSPSFIDHLKEGIEDVNKSQKLADQKASDLATGKNDNIHETMLAASQAELGFNLMVQIRNKALEAYQEVMRMPV